MGNEFLLPVEAFYYLQFFLGPITGGVCAVFMSNLRIWHGLLLGVGLGPVTAVPTFVVTIISWVNTGSEDMTTGAFRMHLLVILCVIPATWGLCALVNRMREGLNDDGSADGRNL